MGWWKRWREWRAARLSARALEHTTGRGAAQESPSIELERHVSVNAILSEIEKSRLEYQRLEHEFKIEELKATAEERKEEREWARKQKEKERELRRVASEKMKEARRTNPAYGRPRKNQQQAFPEASNCLDCIAILTTGSVENRANSRDMLRHVKENHAAMLQKGN